MSEPENINFCQFAECAYLNGEMCTQEACAFGTKLRRWWEWALAHSATIYSSPPQGFHKIYNIYANRVDGNYRLVMEVEDEPQE